MKQIIGVVMKKEDHIVWCSNDDHVRFLERNGFENLGIKYQNEVKELVKKNSYKFQYQF